MPKCLIAYFSMGGTTARVAQAIASGLNSKGYVSELFNLRDGQPPRPESYDLLGVGTPTYYFRPSFNVLDYLNGLPSLKGSAAFAFALHGTTLGDAGNIVRRVLGEKGAREVGYFHCRGADFFLGYLKRGYLFSPDHPTADEVARAEGFGVAVAAVMEGRTYERPAADPQAAPVYRMERFLLNRWLVEKMYSRLFSVNREKCTKCHECEEQCPTRNITEAPDGSPTWGRNCLLCLNCEMKCTQEAITSPVSWPLFRPSMMYNVHRASRDPALDHVRVTHRAGSTKRD